MSFITQNKTNKKIKFWFSSVVYNVTLPDQNFLKIQQSSWTMAFFKPSFMFTSYTFSKPIFNFTQLFLPCQSFPHLKMMNNNSASILVYLKKILQIKPSYKELTMTCSFPVIHQTSCVRVTCGSMWSPSFRQEI